MSEMSEKVRWERAIGLMREHKYSEAYECVLTCHNDLMLIRLMGRTGIVLSELESGTVELMVTRILHILREHDFTEFLVPWLRELASKEVSLGRATSENVKQTIGSLLSWEPDASQLPLSPAQVEDLKRVAQHLSFEKEDVKLE